MLGPASKSAHQRISYLQLLHLVQAMDSSTVNALGGLLALSLLLLLLVLTVVVVVLAVMLKRARSVSESICVLYVTIGDTAQYNRLPYVYTSECKGKQIGISV